MQFHFRQHHYQLTFKLKFFLLCVMLFCVCVSLGIWQLHRYEFKKKLLANFNGQFTHAPKDFLTLKNQPASNLEFQRVEIKGHYLAPMTMLIQNRFYKDELGYEVLTPFQIAGEKKLLLVDRGWQKNFIKEQDQFSKNEMVNGYLKLINEYQFILGKNILAPNQKPLMMQKVDTNELKQITGLDFFPFILRLDPKEPHGFHREWIVTAVTPERHLGYAIQWFGFALILLIGHFLFCCEKINAHKP